MSLDKAIQHGKEHRFTPRSHKVRPDPPRWAWIGECCWNCPRRDGCGECKTAKRYVAEQKERRDRSDKRRLKGVDTEK